MASTVTSAGWPFADLRDVRLGDVGLDLERREVGESDDGARRGREVHARRDRSDALADLGHLLHDDARERARG